jgi:hypothetical protein
MDGTNMSVSTYPMYGVSKPFAALSCSQVLSLCNLSFGSKFLLKNDSVMVLTIEPVSKTEVQTLKRKKQQKQQRKFTKVDKDFICYNCGKSGIVGAKAEI